MPPLPPLLPTSSKSRWWSREDFLLLLVLAALLFLPGLAQIPILDRDEPRFATAAREMSQTGDWIVPHFNTNLRPDKPPLLYWLMNATYAATGGPSALGARLPSAICGTLTLLVVYCAAGARFGRVTGLLAALILGTLVSFVAWSRLATADSTMIFFTTVAMHFLWRAWEQNDSPHPSLPLYQVLLFWLALSLGTLTKGVPLLFVLVPMITLAIATGPSAKILARWRKHRHFLPIAIAASSLILITFNTPSHYLSLFGTVGLRPLLLLAFVATIAYLALHGNWRWVRALRPALGFPILVLLVSAWVIAAWVQTRGELIEVMIKKHVIQRSTGSVDGHALPSGFYLLTLWGTFWPWSILLIPMLFHATKRLLGRVPLIIDRSPYIFLAAWIIPSWILFELVQSKLVHYVLPLFGAMAILCADTLVESWHQATEVLAAKWFASARWIILTVWCAMAAAVLYAAYALAGPQLIYPCILFAATLLAAGIASTIAWARPSWPFVLVLSWGTVLLIANAAVLPNISALQISKIIGTEMRDLHTAEPQFRMAFHGYEEPSLVFYAGGTHIEDWDTLDNFLEHTGFTQLEPPTPYLVAVDAPTFAEIKKRNLRYYDIRTVTGINLANFKPTTVTLLANTPPKSYAPQSRPATSTAPVTTTAPASATAATSAPAPSTTLPVP